MDIDNPYRLSENNFEDRDYILAYKEKLAESVREANGVNENGSRIITRLIISYSESLFD